MYKLMRQRLIFTIFVRANTHIMTKVTYYGHACFLVETGGSRLLFDPFISGNELAVHVDIDAIKADYILLTHAHGDHIADAERIASNNNSLIIANFEVYQYFSELGIGGHPLNHGGKAKFSFGTVKMVNAVHSSGFPDGRYGGNPSGFVVWTADSCFYHAGDTALTMDMQLIPRTCPPLDFCILPIGDNFTMGYEDAVLAAEFVGCEKVIGCHYDTFGFIRIEHDAAKIAFASQGKSLILPSIGETLSI